MNRLPSLLALVLATAAASPVRAAEGPQACSARAYALLGRELKVAHFVPGPAQPAGDPAGVVVVAACKPLPNDPRITLAAVAWDAGKEDAKSFVLAELDEASGAIVALLRDEIDEDASMQVNDGSLRLDTAAYDLAPGVRAVGVDLFGDDHSCGEGGLGPARTLYVREGRGFRAVLDSLYYSPWWYLRGNQPRCAGPGAEPPILEDYKVTIGLGAPGRDGWRDLELTATSTRSDHRPGRKPLRVRVPYDGRSYPLKAFGKAFEQWKQ